MTLLLSAPAAGVFDLKSAFQTADHKDKPLMRWAAQSALISLQLMPQTFSVYVLKKMLNSRLPNWFETQSSKFFGFLTGNSLDQKYEQTQRVDSKMPSFIIASPALSGYEKKRSR